MIYAIIGLAFSIGLLIGYVICFVQIYVIINKNDEITYRPRKRLRIIDHTTEVYDPKIWRKE